MIISHQIWGSLFSSFFESHMRLHPLLQALRKPAPTTCTLQVKPKFLDSHQIRVILQVEPGQAGWRKFRKREEPLFKEKGGSIGTAPDRLAGTAVYFTAEDASGIKCSPHQRREPLLREKAQGLVRFLTSKHHLDAAIPRRSAIIAALQIKKSSTSTKATNRHMKQAFQCDLHTWILLYSGRVRDQILKIGPVAQTRFPPSTPGATLCEKTRGLVRFLTSCPNIISTQQFHCDLQPRPCKSQKNYVEKGCKHAHKTAITIRSAWILLYSGGRTRPRSNPRSDPSVPPIHAGSHLARENTGFGAILNVQISPWRNNSTAICDHHCLANHKRTTRRPSPQKYTWSSQCSAICTPEFYFTVKDASEIKSLRSDPSRLGTTLCQKTQGFVRFPRPNITLTQQFHCDLQSQPCKWQ